MKRYDRNRVGLKTQDPLEDFEGSQAELYFLRFSYFIADNRSRIFAGIGVLAVVGIILIGYYEYKISQIEKASIEIEKLEKHFALNTAEIEEQLAGFVKIKNNYSPSEVQLRLNKKLADLHARKGEFAQAAELMANAGRDMDDIPELKAYYFYIAGNYYEQGSDLAKSLTSFEAASSLIENARNIPTMKAWTFFHTGRLYYLNKNKAAAKNYLKKVIDITEDGGAAYQKAKELSIYLILKLNQEA